jgi:hypothetical protein
MKLLLITLITFSFVINATAETKEKIRKPENLTITIAIIADAKSKPKHAIVINSSLIFLTLKGFKKYLSNLPKNSKITLSPDCSRIGNEPIINSKKSMDSFKEFCKENELLLKILPSG